MSKVLRRILPRGPALLRRLALAEVLGPPPPASERREQMRGGRRPVPGMRGSGEGAPSGPGEEE